MVRRRMDQGTWSAGVRRRVRYCLSGHGEDLVEGRCCWTAYEGFAFAGVASDEETFDGGQGSCCQDLEPWKVSSLHCQAKEDVAEVHHRDPWASG